MAGGRVYERLAAGQTSADDRRPPMTDRYPPIGDYGVVGDCRTLALVSRTGAIDWWCQPRFDGPSVFARILDWDRGGALSIEAPGVRAAGRRYRRSTAVLETRLECDEGGLEVMDFMAVVGRDGELGPAPFARQKLVRLVRCTRGRVSVTLRCAPRPAYGTVDRPRIRVDRRHGRRVLALHAAGRLVGMTSSHAWGPIRDGTVAVEVTLNPCEEVAIVLDYGPGDAAGEGVETEEERDFEPADLDRVRHWMEETVAFWRAWAAVSTYDGPYAELVERSAIALKLLTYHPSGAIIAAGTTSLPETLGGERNWDYRFTWIRDASFTLYALLTLGYRLESDAFMDWVTRTCAAAGDPLVLYRVDGAAANRERELDHLEGYRGSRPVRIGNGAAWQRQLDIYGELLDAAYLDARAGNVITDAEWELYAAVADLAATRWRRADTSIWEVRGGRRHFVYSKVMCWVALDRIARIAEMTGRADANGGRLAGWRAEAAAVRRAVMRRGRRADGAFAQYFGADAVDASALLFPLVGFVHRDAPSARATLRAVERELTSPGGLVHRYRPDVDVEGVVGEEAAFLICSYWLVDNYALRGQLPRAHELFGRLSGMANDLGLFSEEYDPEHGHLGNFPQAFTHIALISAAHNLARAARDRMQGAVRRDAPRDESPPPAVRDGSGG
jgi:alpha,alpha-trehalase